VKNLKLLRVAMLAALAAAVPSFLYASTLTYDSTTSIPLTPTEWASGAGTPAVNDLTFKQFDPTLGTLDSVVLTYSGSMTTTITVTNISGFLGSPATSSGTVATQSVVSIQDSGGDLMNPLSQLAILSPPQSYALAGTPNGNTQVFTEPETSLSDSFTYLAPAVLADFTGSGTIQLAASTSTGIVYNNTGGATFPSQISSAALGGTIIYTYTPTVPEPSALALVGVGFAGLMGFVWRSRRRRRKS
jgi:hypothetical protein